MAIINVDDAYILNETGAQVDKTTGIPFKNESLTEAEAAQARANIRAGGSNDNLLDNAYFVGGGSQLGDGVYPINQRGQASYSGSGNIFDRWSLQNAFATLAADAVYFGSTTQNVWGLLQQVPSCFRNLWGKTVTVSAIIGDELVQETYTIPSSGAFDMPAAGSGGVYINLYSYDGSNIVFRIYTQYTASYHIKAVKLEEGTVSTLANDLPHDFDGELRKCQRYLYIIKGAPYTIFAPSTVAENTNYTVGLVPLPVPMRAAPTVAVSGSFRLWGGIGYEYAMAGITRYDSVQVPTNCTSVALQISTSGTLTIGNRYDLQANNDINASLIFSAEL